MMDCVARPWRATPCSMNRFDLDLFKKVGLSNVIRIYLWSLVDLIKCFRCPARRCKTVTVQIRQRPGDRAAETRTDDPCRRPRVGVSKNTYLRAEKGDPKAGLGVYAMALFVLGFGDPLGTLIYVSRDDAGLLLDEERLPKRVQLKKAELASFRASQTSKVHRKS